MTRLVDVAKTFYGDSFSEKSVCSCPPDSLRPGRFCRGQAHQLHAGPAGPQCIAHWLTDLGYEAFFRGTKTIRENGVVPRCNIWLICSTPPPPATCTA